MAAIENSDTRIFKTHETRSCVSHILPSCPPEHAEEIANRMAVLPWPRKRKAKIAVLAVAHAYVRHSLTDYEDLMKLQGITRSEARIIIDPELNDIYDRWRKPLSNV